MNINEMVAIKLSCQSNEVIIFDGKQNSWPHIYFYHNGGIANSVKKI